MTRPAIVLAVRASLVAGAAGYWAGGIRLHADAHGPELGAGKPRAASGPVIYYREPNGKPFYSEQPKKAADGRDFVPVLASEDVSFEKTGPLEAAGEASSRRVLYYRNPMGLPDTSPVPKKDSMGMDYILVYEDEEGDGSTVKIPAGKLQRTGVKSEAVAERILTTPLHAAGVVKADEHRQTVVALRFDAFVEKLWHATTGSFVRQGEPMMRVYSPVLSAAAAQYLTDLSARNYTSLASNRGARQRLGNLGLSEAMIKHIEQSKEGTLSVEWPAPHGGFVTEHNVVQGMQAKTGDVLFRIADISTVWVLADVAERDVGMIAPGQTATVRPRGYPGKTFAGKITLVYPMVNKETRTVRVRVELANPDHMLLPDMYTDVEIAAGSEQPVLAVPDDAVIDSGTRKLVLLDKGEGRFEPREVTLGQRGRGYTEIRNGAAAGDKVVVSANFLINSESNLKAALQSLMPAGNTQ